MHLFSDSFIWLIKTDDLYQDLVQLKEHFDFSFYPPDHHLYNTTNKGVPGKWKDEVKGKLIRECIFLRSKSYSVQLEIEYLALLREASNSTDRMSKAAGVKKAALKYLSHADYRNTLFQSNPRYVQQSRIGSINHQVYTFSQSRLALSCVDTKRYSLDRIHTLPYGSIHIKDAR